MVFMMGQGPLTLLNPINPVTQLKVALCVSESLASSHHCHRNHDKRRRHEQHYPSSSTHYRTSYIP